jgi:hypothetical protein
MPKPLAIRHHPRLPIANRRWADDRFHHHLRSKLWVGIMQLPSPRPEDGRAFMRLQPEWPCAPQSCIASKAEDGGPCS